MSTLTIELPAEVSGIMEKHPNVNWNMLAQQSLLEYIRKLELGDQLTERSELTEDDVMEIDERIKEGLARRYKLS
jgi:hypothetical protein